MEYYLIPKNKPILAKVIEITITPTTIGTWVCTIIYTTSNNTLDTKSRNTVSKVYNSPPDISSIVYTKKQLIQSHPELFL